MKFPLARNKFSSMFCFYSRCDTRMRKVTAGLQAFTLSLSTRGEVAGSCGFQSAFHCLPHIAHWRQKQTRCRVNPQRCWELLSYYSLAGVNESCRHSALPWILLSAAEVCCLKAACSADGSYLFISLAIAPRKRGCGLRWHCIGCCTTT